MPEQKINFESLVEMLRLYTEATSYARGLRYLQGRIDEGTIAARNRMDGIAECLKRMGLLLRDQAKLPDLPLPQVDAIQEIKQPVAGTVYDLKWKEVGRSLFEIYINGNLAKPVRLTRQEWEFLKFLAESPQNPRDGLASTKSMDEVVAFIRSKSGTADPKKYCNHMVSRIRIALGKRDFSPDLIKRDDRLGVRFAFRGSL
jgi:hypothetical protein